MYEALILIIIIIILIRIFHQKLQRKECVETKKNYDYFDEFNIKNIKTNSSIPKIIWTYWDDCPPELIMGFIKSWLDHAPDHKVIVLTSQNYHLYTNGLITDETLSKYKLSQHKADVIKLTILHIHGGIWMDANMICNESLIWVHTIQKNTSCELVGYYSKDHTTLNDYPVIESFFMACIPESVLIGKILDEIKILSKYKGISEYIKQNNINLQNIKPSLYDELWIQVILQKILQTNPTGSFNYQVNDAENTVFLYLKNNNWDTKKSIDALIDGKYKNPLIKIRSYERNYLQHNIVKADKLFNTFGITDYKLLKTSNGCNLLNSKNKVILSVDQ